MDDLTPSDPSILPYPIEALWTVWSMVVRVHSRAWKYLQIVAFGLLVITYISTDTSDQFAERFLPIHPATSVQTNGDAQLM